MKDRVPSKVLDALDHAFGNGELIAESVESVMRHAELMERESAASAKLMTKLPDGPAPRLRP